MVEPACQKLVLTVYIFFFLLNSEKGQYKAILLGAFQACFEKWLQETLLLAVSSLCLNKESRTSEEHRCCQVGAHRNVWNINTCHQASASHNLQKQMRTLTNTTKQTHSDVFVSYHIAPFLSAVTCTVFALDKTFVLCHKAIHPLSYEFLSKCSGATQAAERNQAFTGILQLTPTRTVSNHIKNV